MAQQHQSGLFCLVKTVQSKLPSLNPGSLLLRTCLFTDPMCAEVPESYLPVVLYYEDLYKTNCVLLRGYVKVKEEIDWGIFWRGEIIMHVVISFHGMKMEFTVKVYGICNLL